MDALKRFLSLATIEQWRALNRDYPRDSEASDSLQLRVLGFYVLAALVLMLNEYCATESFRELLPRDITKGANRNFYRRIWWAWFLFLSYTVPLGLYARFVLGLKLSQLGLRTKGLLRHSWIYVVGFLIVLPLVVMVSDDPHFLKTYPFYRKAGESLPRLLAWELSYAAQFVGLEFFFRGAMLFCAVRLLGPWVIPAMIFPYMMIHFSKPALECLGSIIAGVALGVVSLRTGAIYAGMLVHISVAWTMDLLALWHKGALEKLLFE
jgi:hypothetical protein